MGDQVTERQPGQFFKCFKAYDVRGVVPTELNDEIAYAIGRAYADQTGAKSVCIGYDIRLSGPDLFQSLARGLNDAGVDVTNLGLIGTEMVYFSVPFYGHDGGFMITASHNPPEYNGMKMVREESRPISADTGLVDIEERAHKKNWQRSGSGRIDSQNPYEDFTSHLLKLISPKDLKPLRVLANSGNGAASIALDNLLPHIPLEVEKMNWKPDGKFPNGVPNPILESSRASQLQRMEKEKYDFGVAWDGDYDRCFFFDEHGNFIEAYYLVGLIANALLTVNPHQTIIYDPRLTWNTLDIVGRLGGRAVVCKSGHAFIKEKMRAEDAVYGGEMSAHHYFKDNWYCDSGMIPFLLVSRLISQTGRSLGDLVGEMIRRFPCSGEINFRVTSKEQVRTTLGKVEEHFSDGTSNRLDGLSVEFPDWRFNLRASNTEPEMRLNVESRGDLNLLHAKTREIEKIIRS